MSSSSHPPDELRLPFSLPDRYRVKRHLANGGMASVWCAEDLELDRSVAIKVLAERFAHDAEALRRFKREARAAARVGTHPQVVTVYDVDVTPADADGPGRAFIVMEYLAGGTVADAIRHDDIRRQESIRWLREAASALDHAHAAGIVHRDIKPANFLLDRSRVLHVADFGIAQADQRGDDHLARPAVRDRRLPVARAGARSSSDQRLGPLRTRGRRVRTARRRAAISFAALQRAGASAHRDAPARRFGTQPDDPGGRRSGVRRGPGQGPAAASRLG